MSSILAIDPGSSDSGWVLIDSETRQPRDFGKTSNAELLYRLNGFDSMPLDADRVVIEMIASYGMAVGAEVFETCVWIGRFFEATQTLQEITPELVKRQPVKLHHCHTTKAKDANITQALVDRFASGVPNHGKGTRTAPGWFYGFRADIWQAYALAVYAADTDEMRAS